MHLSHARAQVFEVDVFVALDEARFALAMSGTESESSCGGSL